MRKLGFTLAEVLITLGIIGVIASLTLPSLMTNTAEREYATAWKKAISSLTEAVQMNMAMDNINFDDLIEESVPNTKDNNSLYALLCNRMQTERFAAAASEACDLSLQDADGTETGCLGYSLDKTSMASNVALFFRDGSAIIFPLGEKMTGISGANLGDSEGTCFDPAKGGYVECMKVIYDINGTKKPNLLANCESSKGNLPENKPAEKCTKDTFVARDQYEVALYGMGAYPLSNAGRYLFDRK